MRSSPQRVCSSAAFVGAKQGGLGVGIGIGILDGSILGCRGEGKRFEGLNIGCFGDCISGIIEGFSWFMMIDW